MKSLLVIVLLISTISAYSDIPVGYNIDKLTYKNEEYTKVIVKKITPATFTIMHSFGGLTLYIHKLDEKTRKELFPSYDLEKAKAYVVSLKKNQKVKKKKQAEIALRKKDDKKLLDLMEKSKIKVFNLKVIQNVKVGFLARVSSFELVRSQTYADGSFNPDPLSSQNVNTLVPSKTLIYIDVKTSKVDGEIIGQENSIMADMKKCITLYRIGNYSYRSNSGVRTVEKYTNRKADFLKWIKENKVQEVIKK